MSYSQAQYSTISALTARHEIEAIHNCKWQDFISEHGKHARYNGGVVLRWLGY